MRSINQKMRQKLDYAWLNQALRAINDMLSVLGLEVPLIRLADEDRVLINQWEQARVDKDFALADMLRKKISEKGLL
jgi:cysteinyl-tRNA synthetase